MDRSSIITLVSYPLIRDDTGVLKKGNAVEREVFAQVDSVSRAEFYEAGQSGLKPEYRFTMLDAEYNHEHTVYYNGVAYAVYRTYHARTDIIELYVQREAGVNVPSTTPATTVTPVVTDG